MSQSNFIINRNYAHYNIIKDLCKLIINGNNNKVNNPYKITNLVIRGNNNEVKVIDNGEINYIKIFGNSNKIFVKDAYRKNYIDLGRKNEIIKIHSSLNPSNIYNNSNYLRNNRVNFTSNFDTLQEYFYSYIPYLLKKQYSEKCLSCNSDFSNNDKVKFFSCEKHIFYSRCLIRNIDLSVISPKCPKCESDNNNLEKQIII